MGLDQRSTQTSEKPASLPKEESPTTDALRVEQEEREEVGGETDGGGDDG